MKTKAIAMVCAVMGIALAVAAMIKRDQPRSVQPTDLARDTESHASPATPRIAPAAPPTTPVANSVPSNVAQKQTAAITPTPAVAPKKQSMKNANPQSARGSGNSSPGQAANGSAPAADKKPERVALSLVGADPAAEAYWTAAINDPNISAHDRSDLIEDLNEEGFEDPRNVNFDDLPLIENRLAIIEQLAPDSMDEVNAAAFAEAYKDLINMRAKVIGQ